MYVCWGHRHSVYSTSLTTCSLFNVAPALILVLLFDVRCALSTFPLWACVGADQCFQGSTHLQQGGHSCLQGLLAECTKYESHLIGFASTSGKLYMLTWRGTYCELLWPLGLWPSSEKYRPWLAVEWDQHQGPTRRCLQPRTGPHHRASQSAWLKVITSNSWGVCK